MNLEMSCWKGIVCVCVNSILGMRLEPLIYLWGWNWIRRNSLSFTRTWHKRHKMRIQNLRYHWAVTKWPWLFALYLGLYYPRYIGMLTSHGYLWTHPYNGMSEGQHERCLGVPSCSPDCLYRCLDTGTPMHLYAQDFDEREDFDNQLALHPSLRAVSWMDWRWATGSN